MYTNHFVLHLTLAFHRCPFQKAPVLPVAGPLEAIEPQQLSPAAPLSTPPPLIPKSATLPVVTTPVSSMHLASGIPIPIMSGPPPPPLLQAHTPTTPGGFGLASLNPLHLMNVPPVHTPATPHTSSPSSSGPIRRRVSDKCNLPISAGLCTFAPFSIKY